MTTRKAIGIDLGTTHRVAVWNNDRVKITPNDQGNLSTPSYVAFTDIECLVGDAAKTQVVLNPHNTIFNVKRLLGRAYSDPEVQSDIKRFPFSIIDRNSKPRIRVQYRGEAKEFSPEEILLMLLAYLKETAEAHLSGPVISAVITVPVYFDFAQRQAVEVAAAAAGLRVLRLISEASCSAITRGVALVKPAHEAQVLVLDVGGGSTNVALFTAEDGIMEVRASASVPHLGGDDFDSRLVAHLAQQFRQEHGRDINGNARALRRLRTACEGAKRTLSVAAKTTIAIDFLCAGADFYTTVTRVQFEELCRDLFRMVFEPIEKVLRDAHVDKAQVDKVVLVGGSTRIPNIVKLVADFFDGKEPTTVWPIDRNSTAAHGATLQAAVLSGNASEKMKVEMLTTTFDGQPGVLIDIYEGNRALTKHNTLLARVVLAGITRAPRGVPRIEVSYGYGDAEVHSVVVRGEKRGLSDSKMVGMVVDANVAATRATARARFVQYVRGLRVVLAGLNPAVQKAEAWLEEHQDASIQEYSNYRKVLEAVPRPFAGTFGAAAESGGDGVDIPEADVVDEEVLQTWAVAVVGPGEDDVPPAAPGMGPEDD